jgi:hypothetical protein
MRASWSTLRRTDVLIAFWLGQCSSGDADGEGPNSVGRIGFIR